MSSSCAVRNALQLQWPLCVNVSSLNVWNGGVVLALHNQHVRQCACIAVCSNLKCLIQYEFVISPSCAVEIRNDGDGDGDSIFFQCMERCCVGHGRIGRTCAGLVACLNLKAL